MQTGVTIALIVCATLIALAIMGYYAREQETKAALAMFGGSLNTLVAKLPAQSSGGGATQRTQ